MGNKSSSSTGMHLTHPDTIFFWTLSTILLCPSIGSRGPLNKVRTHVFPSPFHSTNGSGAQTQGDTTLKHALPLFLIVLLFLLATPCSSAQVRSSADEALIVATRHVPPFAIKQEGGDWRGISVDLWREMAEEMGLEYRLREMTLKEMLGAVERGEIDAAVAALTITAERENRMDFTHPFLATGLGIAVPHEVGGGWLSVTERFVSGAFLRVLAALLGLLLVVGVFVWLLERRRNAQFGGTPAQGIGSGLWWSAVTMTTVGYGDKAPVTAGGRALAMVWMFAGVITISYFTAAIATALTVGELGGKVRGKEDLARAHLATVSDSTSAQYLVEHRYSHQAFSDLDAALQTVVDGNADAVVYDAPILRYRVQQDFAGRLRVLPGSFERQSYGIALAAGSGYRESINRILLQRLRKPSWEDTLYRYLGSQD